jgi:hypothetical protein
LKVQQNSWRYVVSQSKKGRGKPRPYRLWLI